MGESKTRVVAAPRMHQSDHLVPDCASALLAVLMTVAACSDDTAATDDG